MPKTPEISSSQFVMMGRSPKIKVDPLWFQNETFEKNAALQNDKFRSLIISPEAIGKW